MDYPRSANKTYATMNIKIFCINIDINIDTSNIEITILKPL